MKLFGPNNFVHFTNYIKGPGYIYERYKQKKLLNLFVRWLNRNYKRTEGKQRFAVLHAQLQVFVLKTNIFKLFELFYQY